MAIERKEKRDPITGSFINDPSQEAMVVKNRPAPVDPPHPFRERLAMLILIGAFALAVIMAPFTWRWFSSEFFDRDEDRGEMEELANVPPVDDDSPATLSIEDLQQLKIHGINADYVRELRDIGLKDLSIDEIVQLGIHDVQPDYIRNLRDIGYEDFSVDEIIQLRIHDVQPDFVRAMQDAGLSDLSIDDLVKLRIHDVQADFVRGMQDAGLEDLSVDKLVQLRIHGVDPEFARELNDLQ